MIIVTHITVLTIYIAIFTVDRLLILYCDVIIIIASIFGGIVIVKLYYYYFYIYYYYYSHFVEMVIMNIRIVSFFCWFLWKLCNAGQLLWRHAIDFDRSTSAWSQANGYGSLASVYLIDLFTIEIVFTLQLPVRQMYFKE